MKSYQFYIPGISLILIAVSILLFPVLLTIIAASMFICSGIIALVIGHRMKKNIFIDDRIFNVFFNRKYFSDSGSKHFKQDVIYH